MSDVELEAAEVLRRYKSAVRAKDVERMLALYDDDVRIFDAFGLWAIQGAPAWRQAVEQWFGSLGHDTVEVDLADLRTDGGTDLAVVSAIVTFAAVSAQGERLRSMQNRFTWSLARRGGVLKIFHEHSSAPISLDDGKAILQRDP
ncbi:YybH family protein [Phenylobacterium sp.]|jgi:uncharacterized protein (TIGR02246 family)|uniref:YybH family protein n=1 Tax=Phenylobacterium sp. TaxID=1871053 RepID=UPI002E36E47D|nr:nuclear transport factor 2 family protein [Phenylobacterium sp.]HEX4710614.1 nuclear transport factor 2 family protein [Phenylobacterium sp.]